MAKTNYSPTFPMFPGDAEAVTPSDTDRFAPSVLYCGTGGTVRVLTAQGSDVTFLGTVPGTVLPVQVVQVFFTSTVATMLVRMSSGVSLAPPRFSPLSLFAAGEPGAWYDPSDLTTLFQDAAGTTAVTAVEQPVGLMLDKSGRGNHASQSTSTARPILRARYNLLTKTEQFDDAAWTKTSLNTTGSPPWVNQAIAPDGSTAADKLIPTVTNSGYVLQSSAVTAGVKYALSVYVKAAEMTSVVFGIGNQFGDTNITVNLSTGVVTTPPSGADSYFLTDVGNGWWRVGFVKSAASTGGGGLYCFPLGTANSSDGIYAWGAQLTVANDLTSNAYQRVDTATVYDADPSKFRRYLAFDGMDDSMSTSAINFTATDKMTVFAGVRKLSDAALGTVAELTATAASNNGAFHLTAPNAASATFAFESKGTALTDAVSGATFAAPITRILTGTGDIAGDSTILRINGAQADADTGDQGSGNYANAALFIGSRNNASNRFNGRIYSLVVRGAATSAPEITATEQYVAGKTGVTL